MGKHSQREILQARKLFKGFNDVDAEHLDRIEIPDYKVFMEIGDCTHIAYLAKDGKNYIHEFKQRSRPSLCTSHDGKVLLLVGGAFRFTDRGIVDR